MLSKEYCLSKAHECDEMGEFALSSQGRAAWHEMATEWRIAAIQSGGMEPAVDLLAALFAKQ
jgi:hypothetical protein